MTIVDGWTEGMAEGGTETQTPISHPAISRWDKNKINLRQYFEFFLWKFSLTIRNNPENFRSYELPFFLSY